MMLFIFSLYLSSLSIFSFIEVKESELPNELKYSQSFMAKSFLDEKPRTIAFYLQDGVEVLDFAGPMEVFAYAGFEVFTVSKTKEPITSQGILTVIPDYDITDAPESDILVLFGGNYRVAAGDLDVIEWIKKRQGVDYFFSVCTGAFILAEAGLLDGQKATTFHNSLDRLKRNFPEIEVLEDVRFVDNGKVITTAGIDGALHMVAKLQGLHKAKQIAYHMEYDNWIPGNGLVLSADNPYEGNKSEAELDEFKGTYEDLAGEKVLLKTSSNGADLLMITDDKTAPLFLISKDTFIDAQERVFIFKRDAEEEPIRYFSEQKDVLYKKKIFTCTPCGLECDTLEFTSPGKCPSCEMKIIEKMFNVGLEIENKKALSLADKEDEYLETKELFAVKNINIIPMTLDKTIIENATIVIGDGKIVSINKQIPEQTKIIDGSGKWLIPGLVDMHVHGLADINFSSDYPTKGATLFSDTQDVMTPYVANGVTTVLELNARVEHFGQRNEIIKGEAIGPRMALAALINGGEGSGRVVNTAAAGRQAVRSAKAEGYEFIKVYSDLNIKTFQAVIDEAKKQGLKTIGHIPDAFRGNLKEAFIPNFNMVAHGEEYAKLSENFNVLDAQRYAKFAKENGTWLTPNLIVLERIADQARSLDSVRNLQGFQYVIPLMQSKWLTSNQYNHGTSPARVAHHENLIKFNNILVKAFKEAGVPIVAGTDAGTSGVIWGFSLHDELELLVEAGLTPKEALASATRLPAVWLEMEDKIGTIEVGKFADLILLDANPLEDINNTRQISGVFVNGQWIDKATINDMLKNLAERNSSTKDKFKWSKRREF